MWVADLLCAQDHAFEGWFASAEEFESQRLRALVSCPMCGDTAIVKQLAAPRLNVSHLRAPEARHRLVPLTEPSGPSSVVKRVDEPGPSRAAEASTLKVHDVASAEALHALYLSAVRAVIAGTEDVGERFPDEARAIHHGDAPARHIRGQASPEQAESLREEGIDVLALAVPDEIKGSVH